MPMDAPLQPDHNAYDLPNVPFGKVGCLLSGLQSSSPIGLPPASRPIGPTNLTSTRYGGKLAGAPAWCLLLSYELRLCTTGAYSAQPRVAARRRTKPGSEDGSARSLCFSSGPGGSESDITGLPVGVGGLLASNWQTWRGYIIPGWLGTRRPTCDS